MGPHHFCTPTTTDGPLGKASPSSLARVRAPSTTSFMHCCPTAARSAWSGRLPGVLERPVRLDWTAAARGPAAAHRIHLDGRVGTAAQLAAALRPWPMLVFEITQSATSVSDGEWLAYVPGRGFTAASSRCTATSSSAKTPTRSACPRTQRRGVRRTAWPNCSARPGTPATRAVPPGRRRRPGHAAAPSGRLRIAGTGRSDEHGARCQTYRCRHAAADEMHGRRAVWGQRRSPFPPQAVTVRPAHTPVAGLAAVRPVRLAHGVEPKPFAVHRGALRVVVVAGTRTRRSWSTTAGIRARPDRRWPPGWVPVATSPLRREVLRPHHQVDRPHRPAATRSRGAGGSRGWSPCRRLPTVCPTLSPKQLHSMRASSWAWRTAASSAGSASATMQRHPAMTTVELRRGGCGWARSRSRTASVLVAPTDAALAQLEMVGSA